MYSPDCELVSLDDIRSASAILEGCTADQCRRTPMLAGAEAQFGFQQGIKLFLKQENTQVTGSFKVRGTYVLLKRVLPGYGTDDHKLVTMSAGNFGKAFAHLCRQMDLKGLVLMPTTAPDNRETLIRSYGMDVERMPTQELMKGVHKHCKEDGMLFMHSFDDINLIAGHGSLGLEILEDVPEPDIVLVCCGGGGLVSGTAAAIKLSGHKDCRIYGVEPVGSRTMYESYIAGRPVEMEVKSVASGLSPPFAGPNCYRHCREFVEDILLVTDEEILKAMFLLTEKGFPVEPSGAAAFAALLHGKVPDVQDKRIVVVLTGSNVSAEELTELAKKVQH